MRVFHQSGFVLNTRFHIQLDLFCRSDLIFHQSASSTNEIARVLFNSEAAHFHVVLKIRYSSDISQFEESKFRLLKH